jgi:hypothetical protein
MFPLMSTETYRCFPFDCALEAILKMIAEGRITPEEGDMLLEAKGELIQSLEASIPWANRSRPAVAIAERPA